MSDTPTETDSISMAHQYLQDPSESSALLGIGWALVSIAESLARAHPETLSIPREPSRPTLTRPPEHALAARLAMVILRIGTMSRHEVDRHFDQVPRETVDAVLAYGHARSWFEVGSDPDRVTRGQVEPSDEDLARDSLYGPPTPLPAEEAS